MMSKFTEALRQLLEDELHCPKCPAMNRPGALLIHLEPDGTATCGQCGKNFSPPERT